MSEPLINLAINPAGITSTAPKKPIPNALDG